MATALHMAAGAPIRVESEEDARQFLNQYERAMRSQEVALDTETTGLDIKKEVVLCWSLAFAPDENANPIRVFLNDRILPVFASMLEDKSMKWLLANAKFDMHMLANMGIMLRGTVYDTNMMDWYFDENRGGRHGLKETALDHLGIQMPTFEDTFGRKLKNEDAGQANRRVLTEKRDQAADYSSFDAYGTYLVFHELRKLLAQTDLHGNGYTLWDMYQDNDVPFTRVLWNMERTGITVDVGLLHELSPRLQAKLDEMSCLLNKAAGWPINPNSNDQVAKLLFTDRNLKPIKMTKGGESGIKKACVDKEVLENLIEDGDKLAMAVQEHRQLDKLKGSFVDKLADIALADSEMKIYCTLNQHGTVTGRLSCKEPNLQQIPKEETFGIRDAFIPSQGKVLIVGDYETLEMRLMAHMSGDGNMINAINSGSDLHCYTESKLFGVSYDDCISAKKKAKIGAPMSSLEHELVKKRQHAKTLGFGMIFGMGPKKLASSIDVDFSTAKRLIENYFRVFPGVKQFMSDMARRGADEGAVYTVVGRPRRLYDLSASNFSLRSRAEREATNSPIQGSAADIAKAVMLRLGNQASLDECCSTDPLLNNLGCSLLLQIHDELIFECPRENAEEAVAYIKGQMETPFSTPLSVPLPVEIHAGWSWMEAK